MKARVVMPFMNKQTGKLCNTGDIIEISAERFAEIKKAGRFVEEVKQEKPAEKKTDKE